MLKIHTGLIALLCSAFVYIDFSIPQETISIAGNTIRSDDFKAHENDSVSSEPRVMSVYTLQENGSTRYPEVPTAPLVCIVIPWNRYRDDISLALERNKSPRYRKSHDMLVKKVSVHHIPKRYRFQVLSRQVTGTFTQKKISRIPGKRHRGFISHRFVSHDKAMRIQKISNQKNT
jgi:hypothetical protein